MCACAFFRASMFASEIEGEKKRQRCWIYTQFYNLGKRLREREKERALEGIRDTEIYAVRLYNSSVRYERIGRCFCIPIMHNCIPITHTYCICKDV